MPLLSIPRTPESERVPAAPRRQNPDELLSDRQTYRDLEIFEASEGGAKSLYDLLNRTRTAGGDKALQARWRKPWSSATRIRAVQDSLRFIIEHRAVFDHIPGDFGVHPAEQHVLSGLPVLDAKNPLEVALEMLELRFGDPKVYMQIERGVRRTAGLVRALRRFVTHPKLSTAPGEVGPWLKEMRTVLDRPAFAMLPPEGEGQLPFWRTLQIDRMLRVQERDAMERLLRLIYELDALVSMADAICEHDFVIPEVVEGQLEIVAEALYHPFLQRPVSNPVKVDQQRRLLFITGPNMAGKTTYLRACGIAVYLAHLGMGVPARAFRFSPSESLFTAISVADNVREGVSFFRAEALRVKTIAQAVAERRRVIALMDEPFMGTNVKDALDASRAVLSRLAATPGGLFLVSSHLIELGDVLTATAAVDCCRFEATEDGGRLEFDYVLRPGVSTQRLGVRVLREEGVFDLLDRAAE